MKTLLLIQSLGSPYTQQEQDTKHSTQAVKLKHALKTAVAPSGSCLFWWLAPKAGALLRPPVWHPSGHCITQGEMILSGCDSTGGVQHSPIPHSHFSRMGMGERGATRGTALSSIRQVWCVGPALH